MDKCIGCGVCVQVCPDVFFLDEDEGKGVIIGEGRISEEQNLVREAIDCCPIGCINW
jgi:ferredoxin